MISQPKVIYRKAYPKAKNKTILRILFTLTVFALTSLVTASIFPEGISLAETPQAGASTTSDYAFASQLLTQTPPKNDLDFSFLDSLTESPATGEAIATPEAQITPTETEQPDFCLDVPVLLYHHIQPLSIAEQLGHAQLTVDSTMFDEQMKYLKDHGYTAISANELVTALITGQQIPGKPIMITIDDGYDDDYTFGFVAAKKYQMIMNFMIPTALIDKPGYMTWDHLKDMQLNAYARIYNHTATHAALGLISQEQIREELQSSTKAFKDELGLDVNIFTYPYGSYNDIAINELKKEGFIAAFTTDDGRHQCRNSIMKLQRYHVGNVQLDYYGF